MLSGGPSAASDSEPEETTESEKEPGPETQSKKLKTYSFRQDWLKQFPWLRYDKGRNIMHCVYCHECGQSMAGNSAFVSGSTTFRIETLKKHSKSKKHTTCRDRCVEKVAPLPAAFQWQAAAIRSSEESEMIIKFNVAYNIAKEELPFTKFKSEIILMKKNGLNVNPTYSNDTACAQFIGVIADTIKQKTAVDVGNDTYMAFMIDGDTDVSTKECVIIYSRILRKGRPVNMLIRHIEVEHAHAQGMFEAQTHNSMRDYT